MILSIYQRQLSLTPKVFICLLTIVTLPLMLHEIVAKRSYYWQEEITSFRRNNSDVLSWHNQHTPTTTTSILHPRSNSTSNAILTIDFLGRIGNLMFQVASTYGIARRNDMSFQVICQHRFAHYIIPVFEDLGKTFPCVADTSSFESIRLKRWGVFQTSALQLSSWNKRGIIFYESYVQSYKYFWSYQSEVGKIFTFQPDVRKRAADLLNKKVGDETTVGVHVRRGDYLNSISVNHGYIVPGADYFERAFNYFRNKYKKVRFIVISEDLDWCRQAMKGDDITFSSSGDPNVDMCILSNTDHIIISVGTYGWMSAFLNRGEVVYFRNIAVAGSMYSKDFIADDFFPLNWLSL